MSSDHHLQLKFAFFFFFFFHTVDEHLENLTVIILSMVSFRSKAVIIYLALMIFNFIPANSAAWNPVVEHVFGPRNSRIVYQNSRLSTIPIFNMIKVNRYDNRGEISSQNFVKILWIHTCSPILKTDQNLAYIALFKRRNKPQNVLNISRGTSNMASDTQNSSKMLGMPY